MSAGRIKLTNYDRVLRNLAEGGLSVKWGDLATMKESDLEKFGYYGAREREMIDAAERKFIPTEVRASIAEEADKWAAEKVFKNNLQRDLAKYEWAIEQERKWIAEQKMKEYEALEKLFRDDYGSEHLASSGQSTEIDEKDVDEKGKILPRKNRTLRKKHYVRKGELETKKEAERRARYAAAGLRSSEAENMEGARKTRKVKERTSRKAAKKTLRNKK